MSRMLPKPSFTMKTTPFITVVFSLVFFASCTKDSLYPIDIAPETHVGLEHSKFERASASTRTSMNITGDTTIQLHVLSSVLNTSAGTYSITFDNNIDLTGTQPALDQHIDFEDTQGQSVRKTLESINFTIGSNTLELVLSLGGEQIAGLQLDAVQSIIIEEVIIN